MSSVADLPPGAHLLEQDFQKALWRALNAPSRLCRVWRANVGQVITRDRAGKRTGTFHAGAPVGAADLTGVAAGPGETGSKPIGVRLEIEVKVDAVHTPEQIAFGEMIKRLGGIYLCIRYSHDLSLADNVTRGVALVDAAIAGTVSRQ